MLSVQLIGLGNIGMGYDLSDEGFLDGQTKTHAKAILESFDFELASFVDVSLEKVISAQKFFKALKILDSKFPGASPVPDLVVVAVSTTEHASVVESLIYPPKILIIEKPAGSTSIECSRIASWGVKNNVQIFINYFRRYLSCSENSRLYFSGLKTGKFLSAEINAYGTLLNTHSHFIDLGFFLTSQQIFCDCLTKTKNQVGGVLVAFCENCNTAFRLGGIGELKQEISMSLEFEFADVLITEDGQRIEIVDKVRHVSKVFSCGSTEYANYQKVVYQKIGVMLRIGEVKECYLGLDHASKVHRFIESVDSNNEA